MKKLIIFDFDGVLLDCTHVNKWYFMQKYPGMTSEECNDIFKKSITAATRDLSAWNRLSQSEMKPVMAEYNERILLCDFFDGIIPTLHQLHEHYTLAINCNTRKGNILATLNKHKIENLFSYIGSREISTDKAEKFELMGNELGYSPDEMLFVTDGLAVLAEVQRAGVDTVIALWGIHNKEDFPHNQYTHMLGFLEKPSDILQYI